MKTLSPAQLQTDLFSESPPIVLDVRLADDFWAAHIAAALNNCVFEVAFHEHLASQVTDKSQRIILVGASRSSHEARMAFEKLERADFCDLLILEGGIEEWMDAGLPIQSLAPPPGKPTAPNGRLVVDLLESRVEWIGRNLLNKHLGTVGIKSGSINCDAGKLIGGEFILDLTRLTCTDLAGRSGRFFKRLAGHLVNDLIEFQIKIVTV